MVHLLILTNSTICKNKNHPTEALLVRAAMLPPCPPSAGTPGRPPNYLPSIALLGHAGPGHHGQQAPLVKPVPVPVDLRVHLHLSQGVLARHSKSRFFFARSKH